MLLSAFRRPTLLIPPLITLTLYLLFHPSSTYTRDITSLGTSLKQYSGLGEAAVPKVHLFLPINKVAADKDKRFCRTIESAVVNGWEPIVYNWAMEGTRSHLLKNKVFGFAKLLNSAAVTKDMAEDDLILLIDALDVWLQLSPTVMGRRFLDYGSDIVIGADKMCWPNPADTHDCTAAPESPLPEGLFYKKDDESDSKDVRYSDRPQHANSGTVIGRLHKMKELYVKLVDTMESERYKNFHSDQGAFNMLLGDGYLRVDPYFRLFWASAYDTNNVEFINTRYPPDPNHPRSDNTTPWELYPALVHHKRTGEVPVAVHFNDYYHKGMLEDWWGKHWWSSDRKRFKGIVKDRMERGHIKFATDEGITQESVKSICPNLPIWGETVEPLTRDLKEERSVGNETA